MGDERDALAFDALLDSLMGSHPLPDGLPAETVADLEVARRILTLRRDDAAPVDQPWHAAAATAAIAPRDGIALADHVASVIAPSPAAARAMNATTVRPSGGRPPHSRPAVRGRVATMALALTAAAGVLAVLWRGDRRPVVRPVAGITPVATVTMRTVREERGRASHATPAPLADDGSPADPGARHTPSSRRGGPATVPMAPYRTGARGESGVVPTAAPVEQAQPRRDVGGSDDDPATPTALAIATVTAEGTATMPGVWSSGTPSTPLPTAERTATPAFPGATVSTGPQVPTTSATRPRVTSTRPPTPIGGVPTALYTSAPPTMWPIDPTMLAVTSTLQPMPGGTPTMPVPPTPTPPSPFCAGSL